jgi:hypothetical protein
MHFAARRFRWWGHGLTVALAVAATAGFGSAALAGPAGGGAPAGHGGASVGGPGAILGTWLGRSLCADRLITPACKDEEVRYVFTRSAGAASSAAGGGAATRDADHAAPDTFHMSAEKFVRDRYTHVYDLDFSYDSAARTWTAEVRSERYHGLWSYTVDGEHLNGSLIDYATKVQLRKVEAVRVHPAGG